MVNLTDPYAPRVVGDAPSRGRVPARVLNNTHALPEHMYCSHIPREASCVSLLFCSVNPCESSPSYVYSLQYAACDGHRTYYYNVYCHLAAGTSVIWFCAPHHRRCHGNGSGHCAVGVGAYLGLTGFFKRYSAEFLRYECSTVNVCMRSLAPELPPTCLSSPDSAHSKV